MYSVGLATSLESRYLESNLIIKSKKSSHTAESFDESGPVRGVRQEYGTIWMMNHRIWVCVDILNSSVLYLSTAPPVRYFYSVNQNVGGDNMSAIESKLNEHIVKLESDGRFSGAVLVASKGELLLRQGYGMASYEHGVPNTPETVFRIGSMTKQFTAVCILQLVDKGIIQLHDSIDKFIPEFPNGDIITIHHLLSHSSGIWNLTSAKDVRESSRANHSVDDLISKFIDAPLAFAPGEGFNYSNSGYILLGKIIEVVTGTTYEEYLVDNVFTKIGMNHSGYDHNEQILKNRAMGYVQLQDGLLNSPYLDMSWPYAAGGLYSTVDDLLLWDRALYEEALLTKESISAMFTPSAKVNDAGLGYAYGWFVNSTNPRVVFHGGSISGFRSIIIRHIDDYLTCIVLSNIRSELAVQLGWQLTNLVFEA